MSLFITRTSLSTTIPLGSEAERSHARVVGVMSRHVSSDHAAILADPVPVRDGTGIDWYVEDEGEIIALADLSEPEAAELKRRLAEIIQDVLDAADELEQSAVQSQKPTVELLRHSVTFPGEESIWALRTDEGLRPIIVGWGYQAHDATKAVPFHVSTFSRQRAPRRTPRAGTGAAGVAARAGEESRGAAVLRGGTAVWGVRGSWLYALLLSLLMLLLLALIVAFLLPACGLRTPFGTIVFGLPEDAACHRETVSEPQVLAAATLDLERELQVLQEELLRRERSCMVEQAVIEPVPEPQPEPQPEQPQFSDVIDDRGEYQVTLMWDSVDDLDLHVTCPSGAVIYYSSKSGCGGILDVDANAGAQVMNPPIENVTFQTGLEGTGPFEVHIVRYNTRSQAQSVPYRVRVRTPTGERILEGSISDMNFRQPVTTFSRE